MVLKATYISMTSLLTHKVAQPTQCRFLTQKLNLPNIFFRWTCGCLISSLQKKCPVLEKKLFQNRKLSKNDITLRFSPNLDNFNKKKIRMTF